MCLFRLFLLLFAGYGAGTLYRSARAVRAYQRGNPRI